MALDPSSRLYQHSIFTHSETAVRGDITVSTPGDGRSRRTAEHVPEPTRPRTSQTGQSIKTVINYTSPSMFKDFAYTQPIDSRDAATAPSPDFLKSADYLDHQVRSMHTSRRMRPTLQPPPSGDHQSTLSPERAQSYSQIALRRAFAEAATFYEYSAALPVADAVDPMKLPDSFMSD